MVWELKRIRLKGEKVEVFFCWDLLSMIGWLSLDQDIVGLWLYLDVIKKINWVSSTYHRIDNWLLWSILEVGRKHVGGFLEFGIRVVMNIVEGLEESLWEQFW